MYNSIYYSSVQKGFAGYLVFKIIAVGRKQKGRKGVTLIIPSSFIQKISKNQLCVHDIWYTTVNRINSSFYK